jgi:5'-nucleotidase
LVSDIRLTLDGTTGDVERFCAAYSAANVPVARNNPDPAVAAVVKYWNDKSAVEGNRVVGSAEADIRRAGTFRSDGSFDAVRTAESGLGNLVAQAQLEAVQDPAYGSPVIAFMNPGGLRTDILQGEVTYSELFDVQPFGNTVNVITLTGADIRAVLEQQFQAGGPRGDTLILGTSEGFSYQYDTSNAYGQRIDPGTIRLNGTTIDPVGTYRVVANSFLITGGDSFKAFTNGTGPATGPLDVDTAVLHFQRHSPVRPPATGHGVAATFATDPAPATGLGGTASEPAPVTTVDASTGLNGTVCDATATIADDTPMRGDRATVAGLLFAPGEQVTATLDEGAVLGGATADPSGAVSIDYRVPVSLGAGQYTVTLTGASGEHASDTFTLDPLWVELTKRLAALFHQ